MVFISEAVIVIDSLSPLLTNRMLTSERKEGEASNEYNERQWRERIRYNENGMVVIREQSIGIMIMEAMKYLVKHKDMEIDDMLISGKSFQCKEAVVNKHSSDVLESAVFRRGRRTLRLPIIPEWKAEFKIEFDPPMDKKDFLHILAIGGLNVGLGSFTPRHGWGYGRFCLNQDRSSYTEVDNLVESM